MSRDGLWVALSMAISAMGCLCTENDSCDPHELLDSLYVQVNGLTPQQPQSA